MSRRTMICHWKKRAVIAFVAGLIFPIAERISSCWEPGAEACIWSKAYVWLSVGIGLGIAGVVYLVLWLVAKLVCKKSSPEEAL